MSGVAIGSDDLVRWSRDPLAAEVSGQVVLMSVARGAYYGLDDTGSDIWRRLEQPVRVSDLCAALCHAYDGDPEKVEADVLAFLRRLVGEGLVEVATR